MLVKEINQELLRSDSSNLDKIRAWINDHDPIPFSIQFWFDHHDIFHPSRIFRKLRNIVRWIQVLWDDVDWDYSSLYLLMATKIKFMRECQISCDNHTDCGEIAAQMQMAENCLQRLVKDDYAVELWAEHRKKFPRKGKSVQPSDERWLREPMSSEEQESFRKLIREEEKLRQRDMDLFCLIFNSSSRGWWD